MRTPTGKWILKINVQNSGYNKITDLSLIKYHRSGRYPPPEPETEILHSSETLLGNDLVNIESKELANVQPNLEDGRPPSYDLVGQWENLAYSIRVKWRKTSYTYSYIIRDGNSINIVGSYQFNGKGYSDSDADVNRFLKDIQEYIRNQDKANSN